VWLADTRFAPEQRLLLRTATDLVPVDRLTVKARLDLATLAQHADAACGPNDIVVADIDLGRPAVLDRFADAPETGTLLLIDALSGATVAGGVVEATRDRRHAAHRPRFRLTRALLARGLCVDVPADAPEFFRRANEVRRLMEMAGVSVHLDSDEL
jgi:bifunctional enzyme CysN/CysC